MTNLPSLKFLYTNTMKAHEISIKICIFILFISLTAFAPRKSVTLVSSTPETPWKATSLQVKYFNNKKIPADIIIHPQQATQVITGFGGCFNEMGWEALQRMPAAMQDSVLSLLFSPAEGCRFTLCRMPIGANDYALDWYSFNEDYGDYGMQHFSIERDRQRLIPYIKQAQARNPSLRIWASPWCPPSWMKTNGHYACRSQQGVNDLPEDRQGAEMVTQFRMEEPVLKSYALYFRKFIEAYAAEGIAITAVHPQNELNSCQNFPSCIWRPEDMARFIGSYLGPELTGAGLNTEIYMGTVERPQIERLDPILQDPLASKYIRGVGFQWAGKDAIAAVHAKYPKLSLIQSETECGDGSNDWKAAEHTWELMQHYLKNGAGAYMYWNMILDETGKSRWGWKQNSMISVNSKDGKVTFNPEFYLMRLLSGYVSPGARFVPVEAANCLAFTDHGKTILLVYNPDKREKTTRIQINGENLEVVLPATSFNAVVL